MSTYVYLCLLMSTPHQILGRSCDKMKNEMGGTRGFCGERRDAYRILILCFRAS